MFGRGGIDGNTRNARTRLQSLAVAKCAKCVLTRKFPIDTSVAINKLAVWL